MRHFGQKRSKQEFGFGKWLEQGNREFGGGFFMDKNTERSKVEGMSKRLFLLDGMALVYRAHFAFANRPILTSAGVNTSALFGFANTLLEIQEKHRPSHIAAAFDTPEPTARHREYPAYKAQRETMPEALQAALPAVERLCAAFRIPTLKCPGHEADDIAGTLAQQAEAEEFETYMVTPDKDFAQLVSPSTFLLKPGRKGGEAEVWKLPEVLADWGVERTEQVCDVLGLWGDASDNIPGVPGIGRKTAGKLILQYGSVENLLKHLGELKGKMRQTLEEHREAALLAKRLVTIDRKAPISVRLSDLASQPPDEDALRRLCIEFEFNSIGRRLFGPAFKAGRGWKETAEASPPKSKTPSAGLRTAADVDHEYVCVQTESARRELAARLADQEVFCFDTETTGLDAKEAKVLGLAFAFEERRAFYVPVVPYDEEGREVADGEVNAAALEVFRDVLENPAIDKVGHNLKYDLGVLLWRGLRVRGKILDTMLLHCLIEPELRHGMDFLAERYLGYSPISIASLIGQKGTEQRLMTTVSLDRLKEYAAEDADVTWQLYQKLRPKLKEVEQESVYFDIEEPLIRILAEMEYEGIRLDSEALRQFSTQLGKQAQQLERSIYEAAGTAFNLNSPKQLGQVLFGRLRLGEKPKKTKTGQYSTSEQVLVLLAPKHEIVRKILDYRAATKLKSTYADALPEAIFEASGRVHTTFHQAATVTGRLNSQRPNLQNIPIRTESSQEIRRAFVPRSEGYLLMSADYSQIELRIIAALSGDKEMQTAFRSGNDVHTATAAKVFGVSPEMVTSEMRRKAKMANFGIAYGISAFGLSQRLGISRGESAQIIQQFFENFPGIKNYIDQTLAFARKHGYVQTVSGRRRYLRDIHSANATVRNAAERNAVNSPIQGTAADLIKIAMGKIGKAIEERKLKTRLLLQVHDELIFDLWREEEEEAKSMVIDTMENALPLSVPLEVNIGIGRHWLEAH